MSVMLKSLRITGIQLWGKGTDYLKRWEEQAWKLEQEETLKLLSDF